MIDTTLGDQTVSDLEWIMRDAHEIDDPDKDDFHVMTQEEAMDSISMITSILTALLGSVAAISLVVGGIGIMNIMLVTVTERTREIGLRKALGAKKKWITTQFLLEAIMITLIGGIIGIILGVGIFFILSRSMGLPFVLSLPSIFLAFGVVGCNWCSFWLVSGSSRRKYVADRRPEI